MNRYTRKNGLASGVASAAPGDVGTMVPSAKNAELPAAPNNLHLGSQATGAQYVIPSILNNSVSCSGGDDAADDLERGAKWSSSNHTIFVARTSRPFRTTL